MPAGYLRDLHAEAFPDRGAGRAGAEIHDHDRDVTYRATVDAQGALDYLSVEVRGHIDDNAMRRVPVARIRRQVLAQVAAQAQAGGDRVLTLSLPGTLSDRPSLEEVAALMAEGRDRAWFHAAYPSVPPRTVDGWMTRARRKYPQTAPGSQTSKEKKK